LEGSKKMTRLGAVVILALAWTGSAATQSALGNTPDAPAQSDAPAKTSPSAASLPKGTGIVGILSTNLDTKHSRAGDRVEVEVTQDVKPADRILLKKGSHITGQITQVNGFSKGSDNAAMEIVFDKVVPKGGEQISTYLAVFALAAKRDESSNDLQDGRGLAATSTRAGVAGGMLSAPAPLRPDAKGIFRIDGMSLVPIAKDKPPTSLLHSDSRNIHLEKGTEIVLVVVGS
jgi:hypothetical protein